MPLHQEARRVMVDLIRLWVIVLHMSCNTTHTNMYMCICVYIYIYMVESHKMDSLLKLIFSIPNGIFTCYSIYLNRQSIKVMDDNLNSQIS